jgi:hypothetical protein
MKIVFLDIDGVVLPRRAWAMPANRRARELLASGIQADHEVAVREVTFDPMAVALVNRLCEVTGAKLVIHSNWRKSVGSKETMAKLVGQGVEDGHFHAHHACPYKPTSHKQHDVGFWLDDNRLTSPPTEDELDAAERREPDDPWGARARVMAQVGFDYLLLDDEPLMGLGLEAARVPIDGDEGFLLRAYRTAVGFLGGVDPQFGVHAVSGNDMAAVISAACGNRIRAAQWLHAGNNGRGSPASRLDADHVRLRERRFAGWAQGDGEDVEAAVARSREAVMEKLAREFVTDESDSDARISCERP